MRKIVSILVSLTAALGLSLIVAPSASATANGCGDLSNGQLCVKKPSGVAGDFTSEYFKHSGSDVTVKLGVQFKNSDDHTYDPDWIATRTAVAGKYARATQYFTTNPGWCVRATMQSGGSTFISKWLCY